MPPYVDPARLVAPYLRPYGQTATQLAPTFAADRRQRAQIEANKPYRELATAQTEKVLSGIKEAEEAKQYWADLMGNAGLTSSLSSLLPSGLSPEQALRLRKLGVIGQIPIPSKTTTSPYASSPLGIFNKESGEILHKKTGEDKFDLIQTTDDQGNPIYKYVSKGSEQTFPVAPKKSTGGFTEYQKANAPVILANDIFQLTHDRDGNELDLGQGDLFALKQKANAFGYDIVPKTETIKKSFLGIDRLWPDKVSTQYDLIKLEKKPAMPIDKPNSGLKGTPRLGLSQYVPRPPEIKTTSQAVKYLVDNHDMTSSEAAEYIRSNWNE